LAKKLDLLPKEVNNVIWPTKPRVPSGPSRLYSNSEPFPAELLISKSHCVFIDNHNVNTSKLELGLAQLPTTDSSSTHLLGQ
jgi:hypothetical protein